MISLVCDGPKRVSSSTSSRQLDPKWASYYADEPLSPDGLAILWFKSTCFCLTKTARRIATLRLNHQSLV